LSVCLSCPVCDVRALWPNGCADQDETWYAARSQPWPHCVRWGPSSPPPKGHRPPSPAHICCGQMAAWIKMPLGMDLGLSPGDCVRWRHRSPSPKRGRAPKFSAHVYCGQTAGCIKMVLGMERPQTRRLCVRWGPSPPPKLSANVYYSYCDFVRTLHRHYWIVQVQVSAFYALYF